MNIMHRMGDYFNLAYINLLLGGIGICLLIIPALIGYDHVKLFSDVVVSQATKSVDFKVSGVSLFVSSLPMTLDLIMDFLNGFSSMKSMHCWIGRAAIAIAALMVGLQFTLQYDYFHLFEVYATSCFLAILLFRIVLMTSIMFCLCAANPSLFTVNQTVSYSALTIIAYVCRFYTPADDGAPMTTIIKILIYIWLLYSVYLSSRWSYCLWKTKKQWNADDYTCTLYLSLFVTSVILSCLMLLANFFGAQFFTYDFLNSSLSTLLLVIYAHTFESILICIIPGRIARFDAIHSGNQLLDTKKAYVRYISHELRTPLNSVHMGIQLSIDQISIDSTNPYDIERLETLYEVSWACEVALEILNDLLLFDKLESGLLTLVKERVPILDFITNCLTMFSVQLRAKNIHVTLVNQQYDDQQLSSSSSSMMITPTENPLMTNTMTPCIQTSSSSNNMNTCIHTNQTSSSSSSISVLLPLSIDVPEVYSSTAVSSARSVISNIGSANKHQIQATTTTTTTITTVTTTAAAASNNTTAATANTTAGPTKQEFHPSRPDENRGSVRGRGDNDCSMRMNKSELVNSNSSSNSSINNNSNNNNSNNNNSKNSNSSSSNNNTNNSNSRISNRNRNNANNTNNRSSSYNSNSSIHENDCIDIDRSKLGQVIRNVMSNAIKFTPNNGSIQITVEFIAASSSSSSSSSSLFSSSSSSSSSIIRGKIHKFSMICHHSLDVLLSLLSSYNPWINRDNSSNKNNKKEHYCVGRKGSNFDYTQINSHSINYDYVSDTNCSMNPFVYFATSTDNNNSKSNHTTTATATAFLNRNHRNNVNNDDNDGNSIFDTSKDKDDDDDDDDDVLYDRDDIEAAPSHSSSSSSSSSCSQKGERKKNRHDNSSEIDFFLHNNHNKSNSHNVTTNNNSQNINNNNSNNNNHNNNTKNSLESPCSGMLVIEIKDSGVGISEVNQKRLFQEIVQFNPEVLQGGGGSGLGMWIAKGIMDLHGGKISVHSQGESMGSTFRLEIPMTTSVTDDRAERGRRTSRYGSSSSSSSTNNCINDDNRNNNNHHHNNTNNTNNHRCSNNSNNTSNNNYDNTRKSSRQSNRLQSSCTKSSAAAASSSSSSSMKAEEEEEEESQKHEIIGVELEVYNDDASNRMYAMNINNTASSTAAVADTIITSASSTTTAMYDDLNDDDDDDVNETESVTSGICSIFDSDTSACIRRKTKRKNDNNDDNGNDNDKNTIIIIDSKQQQQQQQPLQTLASLPLINANSSSSSSFLSSSSSSSFLSSSSSSSLNLLIVDDSAMNRKMLRRLMELQGHHCEEAADGQIALNMVMTRFKHRQDDNNNNSNCDSRSSSHSNKNSSSKRNNNSSNNNNNNNKSYKDSNNHKNKTRSIFYYDAILMDSVMPNMNGPTSTTAIRKLGYTGPIIGVTGNALAEDQQAFIKMGATRVFTKPINVAFIIDTFKEFGLC